MDLFSILFFFFALYLIKNHMPSMDKINQIPNSHQDEDNIVLIRKENHTGVEYWFNSQTEEFIAQGKNKEELLERIKERYKGKNMIFFDEENKFKFKMPSGEQIYL